MSDPFSSHLGRIRVAATIGGRELVRDPVLIGLLLFLPVYFVGVWAWSIPADPIEFAVPGGEGTELASTDFQALTVVLITPLTVALLVGITALFLVQRSACVDDRLRVVGFSSGELLVARFVLLAGITLLVVGITMAMALAQVSVANDGWFVLALLFAAAIYGVIGTIVGTVLGRMAGVYTLLFAPMIDLLLLQMPVADTPGWADWLPGHHPIELALSAAFAETVALEHAGWSLLVLGALIAVAILVSQR